MDEFLMRFGVSGWCADCAAETVFVPVEEDGRCCTVCDAAVYAPLPVAVASSAAA